MNGEKLRGSEKYDTTIVNVMPTIADRLPIKSKKDSGEIWLSEQETKMSPKFFCPNFFPPPLGHGRPRIRVIDVRAQMLVFPWFPRPARSLTRPKDPRMSAGHASRKLSLWAVFVPDRKEDKRAHQEK